jgi:hypothetical protein
MKSLRPLITEREEWAPCPIWQGDKYVNISPKALTETAKRVIVPRGVHNIQPE